MSHDTERQRRAGLHYARLAQTAAYDTDNVRLNQSEAIKVLTRRIDELKGDLWRTQVHLDNARDAVRRLLEWEKNKMDYIGDIAPVILGLLRAVLEQKEGVAPLPIFFESPLEPAGGPVSPVSPPGDPA